MTEFFSNELYIAAIKKELKRQNLDIASLAEKHAINMIDEIMNILDTPLSSDEKIESILKVVTFCSVPPHI